MRSVTLAWGVPEGLKLSLSMYWCPFRTSNRLFRNRLIGRSPRHLRPGVFDSDEPRAASAAHAEGIDAEGHAERAELSGDGR